MKERDQTLRATGTHTLVGNGGADVFVFKHSPGAASGFDNPNSNANVDTILDFTTGEDTIELAGSIFTALSEGTLDPDAFVLGTEALDADDRIDCRLAVRRGQTLDRGTEPHRVSQQRRDVVKQNRLCKVAA